MISTKSRSCCGRRPSFSPNNKLGLFTRTPLCTCSPLLLSCGKSLPEEGLRPHSTPCGRFCRLSACLSNECVPGRRVSQRVQSLRTAAEIKCVFSAVDPFRPKTENSVSPLAQSPSFEKSLDIPGKLFLLAPDARIPARFSSHPA